jgi:DNA damage-inducible protein 1
MGHRLGESSASAPQPQQSQGPPATQSQFSEVDIQSLMDLGISRAMAIQFLEAAGGNVDVAASMLFQG